MKSSPGLNSTKYLRQTNSCLSNWSAFSLDTRSWVLDTRPLSVTPAWEIMVDTSIYIRMRERWWSDFQVSVQSIMIHNIHPKIFLMIIRAAFCAFNGKLYLLSCDQIYAALFAIGHLSTEVIQDQQLTPTALQQHHLVLHLEAYMTLWPLTLNVNDTHLLTQFMYLYNFVIHYLELLEECTVPGPLHKPKKCLISHFTHDAECI